MPTMKATPEWLRSGTVTSPSAAVDRKANVLRGYVLAQAGPFKSEGRGEFDRQSLEAIVKLGNTKAGLKSRFTHPDMSNDGLGKFLGRAHGLAIGTATDARTGKRVDAVRGDLHFDPTALDTPPNGGKPLGLYVMDLAESDPGALSSSLVLHADEEWRTDDKGNHALDKSGNELPPLWRPTQLHASDIVDTGDAVDGLLSAQLDVEGLPLSAIWKGAQLLDGVFHGQPQEVVRERLLGYVERYLERTYNTRPAITINRNETTYSEPKTPRLDALRAGLERMAGKLSEPRRKGTG